jgi:hypothetical protein
VESLGRFNPYIEAHPMGCQLPSPVWLKVFRRDHQPGIEGGRIDPYSGPMTEALTDAIETATAAVTAIDDPVERFKRARTLRAELGEADRALLEVQRTVIWGLYEDRTWGQVGELLGFSGSRAEAIARGR